MKILSRLLGMFCFLGIILLSSCRPTVGTLIGKYQDTPYEIKTDKSLDVVWSNIIDFFAQKGISIKIIDKSSGLIICEKTSFLHNYTFEINGTIRDYNAWIVLNHVDYAGAEVRPDHVTGEWNVRIKPAPTGGTLINVNLTNIDASMFIPRSQYSPGMQMTFTGKSTGKFEPFIAQEINK